MSTIRQIIARVDDVKINAFNEETKTAWIAELDGKIALDVMLMSIEDAQRLQYAYPTDLESEPMVKFPHDSLYDLWLGAKIDFANGEYNKYQNSMEMFNAHYGNYVRWFAQFYEPAQGYGNSCRHCSNPPYYISAYSLAVSRGFEGTLDQWLASLVGKKVAIRYEGDKVLWRWIREGEEDQEEGEPWTELIDVEALQKSKPVKGVDYFTEEDLASLKTLYIPVGEQDFGSNNEVGLRGYYFTAVDFAENKFTLSMKWDETDTEGLELAWSVGDVISIKNDNWYGYCATITAIEGNVITVDAVPFGAIGANLDYDNHVVVVPAKPLSGQVELCRYAASFGYNSGVHTKGGFNAGGNNYIGPSAGNSATIGSELKNTASNAVAVNYKNEVHADNSFVGGMGNIIHRILGSGTNFVFGYLQQVWGNFCAMLGYNNKIVKNPASTPSGTVVAGRFLNSRGSGQFVCGEYNEDDGTDAHQGGRDQNSYFVVGGGTASNRKTRFRVRRTGNTDLCGNKIENLAGATVNHEAVNLGQLNAAVAGVTTDSIGAAKSSHTHTPASIGAAKSSHTHSDYASLTWVKSYVSGQGYATQDFVGEEISNALTGTGTAYLPPTMADLEACTDARGTYNEMYDLNGDGVVDLVDGGIMYMVMQGDFSDWTNKKKSNVTVTINPSNPDGVIHITGTNMWGSTIEADIGVDMLFLKGQVEFLSDALDTIASRVKALEDAAES